MKFAVARVDRYARLSLGVRASRASLRLERPRDRFAEPLVAEPVLRQRRPPNAPTAQERGRGRRLREWKRKCHHPGDWQVTPAFAPGGAIPCGVKNLR